MTTTIQIQISDGADDATELAADGSIESGSTHIDMGDDDELWAVYRFQSVGVPPGADIVNAYVTFTCYTNRSGAVPIDIYGHDAGNSSAFSEVTDEFTDMPKTTATVEWNPGDWTVNLEYDSADIGAIVQEIVARGDWAEDNDISIVFSGHPSGVSRQARSYDGVPADAAILTIEFDDSPPVVNGPTEHKQLVFTTHQPSVSVGATATDAEHKTLTLTTHQASVKVVVATYAEHKALTLATHQASVDTGPITTDAAHIDAGFTTYKASVYVQLLPGDLSVRGAAAIVEIFSDL